MTYRLLTFFVFPICRDDWIRTSDPVVPNDVRYQAALHPAHFSKRHKCTIFKEMIEQFSEIIMQSMSKTSKIK